MNTYKIVLNVLFTKDMAFLRLIPILFIFIGVFPYDNLIRAEVNNPKDYKVLSKNKLSIANVKYFLKQGDKFIEDGNFDKAKDSYQNARKLATQLASFYSDINKAFKGVDARIPNEMQRKGKSALLILAETNKRLAALYIKNEKPDVAVPILIETIRIMSPSSPEGKEAYNSLMKLGFVETTFKG